MEIVQRKSWYQTGTVEMIKGFLIWSFTLTVCLLVVGFPLIVLMATVGALLAVTLQSVLPTSAVLLVAGSIIGANIVAILLCSAILTVKGIHPQQISWLRWLHGDAKPVTTSQYARCPLTCSINDIV